MTNRVGQQFGNYRLVRFLGRGGFAEVYLGEHIYLKNRAALKVLHTQLSEEDSNEFLAEAQTLARLSHPNIVRVLDFGVDQDGTAFLVTEYAPRGTLRNRHPSGSCLALETISSYVKQIASALHYAHEQRIIHRDVKPENILLGSDHQVQLGDFGLSLFSQSNQSLEVPGWVGTLPYMAPELFQGRPEFASDQYALGILAYEWLCGKRPFQGAALAISYQQVHIPPPRLRDQDPSLPEAVEGVVLKALAKEPKQRYTSVQHFAQAFGQACQRSQASHYVGEARGSFNSDPASTVATSRRIFLSTAHGDEAFGIRLAEDVQMRGMAVWTEQANGAPLDAIQEEEVRRAIRAADAVLLVATAAAQSSAVVQNHLRIVGQYQRQLVCVQIAGTAPSSFLPQEWPKTIQVDLVDARTRPYEHVLAELLTCLERDHTKEEPRLPELVGEPRSPYKGLRAFTQVDAPDFFGRERLVEELAKRVKGMATPEQPGGDQERLLTVIGPSGAGKSSVVLAGLLPRLQQDTVSGRKNWLFLSPMVPGDHPLEALALTLAPHLSTGLRQHLREELLHKAASGLHRFALEVARGPGQKAILFIDQFEEIFAPTVLEQERQQFIDLLVTAATEAQGPVIVLFTLRADVYHRCIAYPKLHQLIEKHQKTVFPMAAADLRAVVKGPAALPDVQVAFEGHLVNELLFEVQEQVGALPLLQFTLEQLFLRRKGRLLTLQAYREIGGVRGALVRHIEAVYAALPSEEHRHLARLLFLRLIDPGATEQDTTRRRASLVEFTLTDSTQTHLLRETLDAFIAARLVTTNEIAGTTTIEVSHEALIREWPRLAEWIRTARQDILLQQTLSRDVADWQRGSKPRARLYRDSQLKEARIWASRNTASAQELTFLQASLSRHRRSMANLLAVVMLILASLTTTTWLVLQAQSNNTRVTQAHQTATASALTVLHARLTATVAEQNRRQQCAENYLKATTANGVMFGLNAQHTRTNPYECILSANNVATLVQKWASSVYTGYSSPAVANGVMYVGSVNGQMYALDARSGQQKWVSPTGGANGNSALSSPAVANGMVYVGSEDYKLYAFDATSGQQKWSAPTADLVTSSPAVANGMVYVGSRDYKLYAFDATSGQQKWAALTGGIVLSSPAVANRMVYVGSDDGKLYAFDATSGQQKWAVPTASAILSSSAVANGMVYVGSKDGKLYAFDAISGQQKWAAPTSAYVESSPAVANEMVYVGSYDGKLYAFDATTGQQKWAAPTGYRIESSPAVANGIVYVGSDDGELYAFDATTGQQKWASSAGGFVTSSPAVANGMVYVGSDGFKMYAFSLPGDY